MAKKKTATKKTAVTKPPKKATAASRKKAAPAKKTRRTGNVTIRMFCQGLGDCFLLSFPPTARGGRDFHVLIDCGIILGTPSGDARIVEVVKCIATLTGGDETKNKKGQIDLLVGTHEHWDHVSGFVQAEEVFKSQIDIKQTWLAWTEDPKDKLAQKLRAEREQKKQKLALALTHFGKFQALEDPDAPLGMHARLNGLSSFFGMDMAATDPNEGLGKTARAMKFLAGQNAKFLTPGVKPPQLDGLKGIEIFVLGPPTDEKLLKKDLPTKSGHEVYEEEGHGHAFAALFGLEVPGETGRAENLPFKERFSMPLDAAQSDPYFAQVYDNGLPDHAAEWRRIDDIGMFAATDLALQLDSDTNNTSLVLAFRLPSGKVLLFPGDAQVGNWESWHQLKLHDGKTTMKELFADTVVYKVGHHGSHNATLSKLGLDMMTSPDLMALLPVDEDVAHNKKGWVRMPFIPLMTELRNRTKGRILRADHEVEHPLTDLDAGVNPSWTPSPNKFSTEPKRNIYLELSVPL